MKNWIQPGDTVTVAAPTGDLQHRAGSQGDRLAQLSCGGILDFSINAVIKATAA